MRICSLCGIPKEELSEISVRRSLSLDGVIDPNNEHDHNMPVCAECSNRIFLASARAELAEIDAIEAESAPRKARARERHALFLAMEEAAATGAIRIIPKEEVEEYGDERVD